MDEQAISTPQEIGGMEDWVDESPDEGVELDEDILESDEADEPAEEPKEEEAKPGDPGSIKIKYNGEDIELTYEEAVELSQKGKNYDKVFSKAQELEQALSSAKQFEDTLKRYADYYGFGNPGEYLEQLNQAMEEAEAKKVAEKDGITVEAAARQLSLQRENAELKTRVETQTQASADVDKWYEFVQKYPDAPKTFDADGPPQAMLDMVLGGAHPISAYEQMVKDQRIFELEAEIAKITPQLKAKQADQKNRGSTPGSVGSEGDEPEEMDAFLRGFSSSD